MFSITYQHEHQSMDSDTRFQLKDDLLRDGVVIYTPFKAGDEPTINDVQIEF